MSNTRRPTASTRPSDRIVDPALAIRLDAGARRQRAQDVARQLVQENSDLLKLIGAILERTGPIEVDVATMADPGVVFEVEKYDATDGLSAKWVSKRVAG